jgi:putative membrane protein
MNKDLILREKLALQRTILANQSTYLAFVRTSMYFLVAGISINSLLDLEFGGYIQSLFIIVSVTLFIIGFVNYRRQNIKIFESEQHIGDYKEDYLKK